VREVGYEQRVVNEIEFLYFALVGVHQKGDLSEGKEGCVFC
jgi:hypothetical protein